MYLKELLSKKPIEEMSGDEISLENRILHYLIYRKNINILIERRYYNLNNKEEE